MCSEEDISIVRYVDSNAAKSIISANSTFLLRSLQYYQDLEILMTISIRFVLNPITESRNVSTTISCVPRQVMVLGQISIGEGN